MIRSSAFLARLILGLVIVFLLGLTGCVGAGGSSEVGLSVPILSGPRAPQEVVEAFLNAWKVRDYAAMYALLSPQSREAIGQPAFEAVYQDAAAAIQLTDLTFTLRDTRLQGLSAAVTYDVGLVSPDFGTIEDRDRTMRLVQGPGGWGVAWSSMDIINGLAGTARLDLQTRRQPRANIYDRNGQILVEQGGTMIALYAARQNMTNEQACLNLLASVLMRRRSDLEQYFGRFNADTVFYLGEIDRDTDSARGQELTDTCAISTRAERETRRYVGFGGAAQVTGYIGQIPASDLDRWQSRGYRPGDLVGLTGVENVYQDQLSGNPSKVLRIVSPAGFPLRELGGVSGTPPQPVTLTLDRDLQNATAQAIADAFNYAEPNWAAPGIAPGAGVVVLDVNTGAVLALASFPYFDPGVFNPDTPALSQNPNLIADLTNDARQPFSNRVTRQQYFPGSTFKIITTSAAAAERLMTPTETFYCDLTWDGRERYGDTSSPRSDWRRLELPDSPYSKPAGDVTMSLALATSCNPFYYEMGARLYTRVGANTLTDYARRMGLGAPTGLDVGPEAPGSLPTPTSVEQGINEAIGQGNLQVTILQMARMVASVANGGKLYKPYVVQQVGGRDGAELSYSARPNLLSQTGLDETTLDIVRAGMCGATTDTTYGTAWFVFEGAAYTACGKTGTAQSGRREPYGWFVAYAPRENPQIAIAAMVEFSREGSETAAPIIRRILDAYFQQPAAPFPKWWNSGPYIPLEIRVGETGG